MTQAFSPHGFLFPDYPALQAVYYETGLWPCENS